MTLRARWVTLRARWVTLRARWVTFRLKVERTPTFVFFRDGEEIHRHTGISLDVFHAAMAEAGLAAELAADTTEA